MIKPLARRDIDFLFAFDLQVRDHDSQAEPDPSESNVQCVSYDGTTNLSNDRARDYAKLPRLIDEPQPFVCRIPIAWSARTTHITA